MSELTKAHIKFLKEIGTITKGETNDFHHSKYASLEGVLGVVNPVLTKNDLAVSWTYSHEDGQTILNTHLRHASGEELISSAIYPQTQGKNQLHEWGKNNTYMRRFTLLSILGICAGIEDNDGNGETESFLKPSVNTPEQSQQKPDIPNPPLTKKDRLELLSIVENFFKTDKTAFTALDSAYRQHFKLDKKEKMSTHIQEPKHRDFILGFLNAS